MNKELVHAKLKIICSRIEETPPKGNPLMAKKKKENRFLMSDFLKSRQSKRVTTRVAEKILHENKGEKEGRCNREACQAPDAIYFNSSTLKYYCESCAKLINRANPSKDGVQLCVIPEDLIAKRTKQRLEERIDSQGAPTQPPRRRM